MFETLKMSKYNFITYDKEGNLILYNFLTGISSLTKVMKSDIDKFKKLFLISDEICNTCCEEYSKTVEWLLNSGILVAGDINESVLYDAKQYDKIFNEKLTLTIFPTGKCNFRCPYCFETPQLFPRESMSIDSQRAIVRYVQRTIHDYRELHVSLFGGEPLLSPEIIKSLSNKFIKICSARYMPYSADITTNGFLLNADMFDMLYKLKVYDYMVTIDGFKEQHDKRRFTCDGSGTYDIIMNNLLRIRDMKQYRFANIMIRINMSCGFLEILDDFVNFIASSFSNDPRFKFMFVPVVKFAGSKFSDNDIYSDHRELFSRLSKNNMYLNKLFSDELKISSIIPPQKCPAALKNSYVITPDLNVYKCNAHYDFNANKIGHINLKGDLLIDEMLHKRWYLMSKFVKKTPEDCNNCCYLPCCHNIDSGCPVSYLKATPEMFSCPMKDAEQKRHIVETILYAAKKYHCTTIIL